MAAPADVLKMIKDKEVKFVDLRFTDTRGKEQHVSVPAKQFTEDKFDDGHAFDGSSIAGWKGIEASDMLLMPDPDTARIDPFTDETTLNITCDVIEPSDGKGYERDPRSLAKRAEAYLKSHRPGRHRVLRSRARVLHLRRGRHGTVDMSGSFVQDQFRGSAVVDRREIRRRQHGPPRRRSRAATFPVPPVDSLQDIRIGDVPRAGAAWASKSKCTTTKSRAAGQCEIGTKFDDAGEARRLAADPQVHASTTSRTPTARPRPSCRSRSSATTARACTCTSRCGRAARTCSPATATRACRSSRCTTSAASSSTRRR